MDLFLSQSKWQTVVDKIVKLSIQKQILGLWLLERRLVLREALCSIKLITKCPISINLYIIIYNLFVLFWWKPNSHLVVYFSTSLELQKTEQQNLSSELDAAYFWSVFP